MRTTIIKFATSTVFFLAGTLATFGCASVAPGADVNLEDFVLHLDYRGGGDAPVAFLLSFYEDGRVRFHSPRSKTYWARLREADLRDLNELRSSERFKLALADLKSSGRRFACCDLEEVGIFGSPDESVPVVFDGSSVQPAIAELLRWSNEVGRRLFGRRFSLLFPSQ